MKIIEGTFAGKHIAYKDREGQRVTSEKVRKATFDILKQHRELDGLSVADLFAGSGLYGLEALSRGAASATFVDANRDAIKYIKENIAYFGKKDSSVALCQKVERFLNEAKGSYDIVYIDPPYYDFPYENLHMVSRVVAPKGIVIIEGSRRRPIPKLKGFTQLEERTYGDSVIAFFEKD